MFRGGRYGKYGELKRKQKLRKNRLLHLARRGASAPPPLPYRLNPQQPVTHKK